MALFRMLQGRYGFQFLALEQDQISCQLVSRRPVRGNRDSVASLARRYPHAFTFMSDQELSMLADVGTVSHATANPVWGCDQAFGATHILDRLMAITRSHATRELIRRLRDTAKEKERKRDLDKYHYMGNEPKSELFAQLRQSVRPKLASDADMLIQSLIVSDRMLRALRSTR